ncbi:Ig-like domain-containing protein [Listeria newyorkensis]|uniref:Autolysin modifier protein n=1 Tax=Listeria newyorkensis TaxID=1497681 RepID=A0A841YY46_9LIST|nr:Ig-like domain-containing protein [Listeria newyorkensis]MBC1458781.1 autolysin modifier protein [Listeria newyorkensis]
MSTKKNIVRKSGTIALATVLVGSSFLSTLPVNAFASEAALKNVVSEAAPTAAPADATEVSTSTELRAALESKTITDIKLTADIKLASTFNFTTQKNLYGDGHTLDMNMNKIGVAKANSVNRVENLTITNQNIYPLFWSEYSGVQVTYKDVTSSGKQFIYNAKGTAILEGNIKATANYEEIFQGTNLIIKEGADVDFNSVESGLTALYVIGDLTQEANSNMKVNSKSYTLYVANSSAQISVAGNMELNSEKKQAIYATGGNMVVKSGAKFKANAGDTVEEGISITNGSLTVQSGADFVATSKGIQGTVQTGKALTFENGSNFAITNTNATGSVFANYAGASTKININSDKGLSTWDYGFINNDKPTHNYNDFKTATFDLSGWDKGNLSQKNLTSNSAQFQSQFVSKTTGKLFGGSYALTNIAQTTIDDLTTDSTHVVGLAEPNANIVIKNAAGVTLGSGKVGSDGYYDITIEKQAAGTVVTATADSNGITSSASTTVIQAAIEQTTIAPLTTDSTKATGTAEPNADIEIKANGEVIGSGKVGSDGSYSITISQQDVGTRVTATATKGTASSYATTTVTQGDLDQTTISALTTKSTVAEGTAEPNASIEIQNGAGETLGSGKVGSDGKYSITIPKQEAGTIVTATATKDGKTSTAQTTVIRGEIDQTTVNKVTTESVSVSGTAEPNATLVVEDQDGKQLATGRAGSDGIYSLTIAKQPEGTTISVTASLAGLTSKASTIVERDGIDQTTINKLTTDSTSASGTAEPNATIVIKDQDGKQLATGRVGSDGIYSLTIAKQAEGTVVTATATKDGKTSEAHTTVIRESIAPTTINALTADSTNATGTAEPNASIVIKNASGTTIGSGKVGSDGKYNLTIDKQPEGTVVTAIATKDGKTSEAETTVTAGENIAPTTINDLTTDSTTVTGTAEPNASIVVKNDAGTTIGSGKVGSDGKYSLVITPQAEGTVVTATATKDGKIAKAETVVKAGQTIAAPTINDYFVNDGYVTGTAPAGATKVTVEVAGKTIRTVDVAANGTYRIYVNDNAAMGVAGTTFQAYATDANGKPGDKATSTVKARAVIVAPPTINDYVVDGGYVTGKATAPATKVTISVGGKDIRTGDVAADGTFKIYVNDNADMKIVGKEFTAVAKDAAGNVSKPTTATVKGSTLAQPTIDPYYAGQEYVTGKTDKATSKIGLYDKGGNLLRYGAVDAATGTYKIYASDKTPMRVVGDEFSVRAVDVAGTPTEPTKSTILTAILGKPTINEYHKDDEYVTGKTDIATFKIGLYDDNGTLLRTGLVNPDGTYKIYASDKAFMQVIGNNFTVRAINSANVPGLAATSTVLGERIPSIVTASDYNLGDNNVTGTYTGAGAKVQLFVNGVLVKNGALDTETGTYQVYAKDYITATTDKVEIVLYDKNWQELDRTTVNVKAAAGETLKITPDEYIIGEPDVTGTLDGVSTGIRLYVNGELARTGQISGDGKSFAIYAQDKIKSTTDTVTVVGIDKDGKEVTANVTVKDASESPDALKIDATSYKLNTDNITGSYTGTMNGVELWVNDEKARTGGFDATAKTFTVYAKDKVTSASDKVQIKGYDKNWNPVTIDVTID